MILPKQIGERITEVEEMGILTDWQAYDMILTPSIHDFPMRKQKLREIKRLAQSHRKEPRVKPKST